MEVVFVSEEAEAVKQIARGARPILVEEAKVTYLTGVGAFAVLGGEASGRARRKIMGMIQIGVPVISADFTWLKGQKTSSDDFEGGNPILAARIRRSKVTRRTPMNKN